MIVRWVREGGRVEEETLINVRWVIEECWIGTLLSNPTPSCKFVREGGRDWISWEVIKLLFASFKLDPTLTNLREEREAGNERGWPKYELIVRWEREGGRERRGNCTSRVKWVMWENECKLSILFSSGMYNFCGW